MSDELKHYGKKGMRWGIINEDDTSGIPSSLKKVASKNSALLAKNPRAAVVNYKVLKNAPKVDVDRIVKINEAEAERKKKIRNVVIGVGVGLTVVAGAVLYAKNKDLVDSKVSEFMKSFGDTKIKDVNSLNFKEKMTYKLLGMKNVDTVQKAAGANFVASWYGKDAARYAAISKEAYDAMDDNDFVVKPGQIIKRVSQHANEVLRDGAYAALDGDDAARYQAFMPGMWKVNQGYTGKVYSMTMEAVEELKSPSAKQRVNILADLLREGDKETTRMLNFNSKKDDPLSFALTKYKEVSGDLVIPGMPHAESYKKRVLSLGYNALIDDNDAGNLSRSPLVLLKAQALKINSIKEILHSDVLDAISNIRPMAGESFKSTFDIVTTNPLNAAAVSIYYNAIVTNTSGR